MKDELYELRDEFLALTPTELIERELKILRESKTEAISLNQHFYTMGCIDVMFYGKHITQQQFTEYCKRCMRYDRS